MDWRARLLKGEDLMAVVGLGYVGLPLAVAFSKKITVIGFDVNQEKITRYEQGLDSTMEVGDGWIQDSKLTFSCDEEDLRKARVFIIAVPTPVDQDKMPDLYAVIEASKTVGRSLAEGSLIVYESTVYPGVTEELCIPLLEQASGLVCGQSFWVGYSPERINPGDGLHRLKNIVKVVSGMDLATCNEIAAIYELVVEAGVFQAESIKVAEAAKVAENSQRDINIAFMNELAMVFDRLDIDTLDVVKAMETKWNALPFVPGLVGGHCIGVDPYYFIYKAEKLGYRSEFILSGRKINDGMGAFVVEAIIKQLVLTGKSVRDSKVVIFGITFKANTKDIRNSKVVDIYQGLQAYGLSPLVVDPLANTEEVYKRYGIVLTDRKAVRNVDCLIFAVAHDSFRNLAMEEIMGMFGGLGNQDKVLIDIKGIFSRKEIDKKGYRYWRL